MAQRTQGERAGLSRDIVLQAALDLVDEHGLDALTMRRLGDRLGVEAMTIYHHVPNKDALLDGLVELVFGAATPSSLLAETWQSVLTGFAASLRARLLRHPGIVPLAVTRPAATPEMLRTVEHGLAILHAAGFPVGRALDALNALTVFVVGHVASEIGIANVNRKSLPGSTNQLATLDGSIFPLLTEAARTHEGTDDSERFRFAVDALIVGFGALAETD
ncbi:TetR/AcrR family transcriptional regulator C-terminal domain-containing protein [Antrihabitans cavernicola]|uniref:TetR family transcriptional regulator n=1 Tax=Antrihabitans cavernicola TaxID=2495913 RepID=A0A5A7SBH8_9NOCA|nr:TetR/AcrR family transcriptional regulator C-terminal domain-containing protein [Spelaeibacter cavernicola]KAA0023276.1 TetR family transcriptional regulator [Spelaeibacter cavernicola]